MPYPLPLTRTEAYLAYKAGVIQQSDLKPSLAVPRNGIDAWLAYWTGLAADYPKREDGTPHILQEEEAYIAYLCGVINEYPEKCLRRVGAYLRYLISARWGRPDRPLNREELYLSLIKTQFIPSGDPSSDIVIDGTAKAPFVDVKMYGDTYQQTYTGKNLFNAEAIPYVAKRAYSSDGSVVNWTNYTGTDKYQPVEPNTEYTIWNNKARDTTYLCEYDENKNFIRRTVEATTFTTTATTKYLRWSIYVGAGEIPPTQTQLELGATASSFEPYVGGQPSPSPEYPQPIQTVTGEQTVTVTGKNKINMPYRESEWNGGRVIQNGSTLTMKPSSTSSMSLSYSTPAIPVAIPTGETITWSRTWLGGGTWNNGAFTFPLEITYSDGTTETISLGDTTKNNYLVVVSRSVTLAKDVVSVRLRDALCYSIKEMTGDIVFGVQLEYGSTATTYTPYSSTNYPISLGSIELCKLGTYQDYIYKDGDSWKVHKELGNVTLDSTYYNSRYGTNSYGLTQFLVELGVSDYYDTSGYVNMLSNSFTKQTTSFSNTQAQGFLPALDSNSHKLRAWIRISTTTADTADQFKAWLNTNTPIFYYKLNTATDTTITDQTLIAQLEALVNGGAENGTTYIKVSATGPNLPGLLYVEAPKYE